MWDDWGWGKQLFGTLITAAAAPHLATTRPALLLLGAVLHVRAGLSGSSSSMAARSYPVARVPGFEQVRVLMGMCWRAGPPVDQLT